MRRATGSPLEFYSRTASDASSRVISRYSTSFGMAVSLLPQPTRAGIRSLYALVRVADEIVDGTAEEAGLDAGMRREVLDEFEAETAVAIQRGFSANMTVHAFAVVARASAVEPELLQAFFRSMRRDLSPVLSLSEEQYRAYVHGSAEAVGLICLRVFLRDRNVAPASLQIMEEGASRLGAAFQKVNFLRDFGEDAQRLGRAYFPDTELGVLSEHRKAEIVADIDADLAAARRGISLLPAGPRRATSLAAGLFGELNERLRHTPATQLAQTRLSVPRRAKMRVAATSVLNASMGFSR